MVTAVQFEVEYLNMNIFNISYIYEYIEIYEYLIYLHIYLYVLGANLL